MKRFFLLPGILLISVLGFGQAYEGTVEFEKRMQPAAVLELPYPPSVVDAAMQDYLSKNGRSRSNDVKGFTTFRNVSPVQNDSVNANLYIRTDRKSRKEKEVTMVSLLVPAAEAQANTGNLRYMNMEEAKTYLNDLMPAIDAYNLELTIKDQNEAIIKAEAAYKKLTSEATDLEEKRSSIERKIADNKSDQEKQLKEIEHQKQILSDRVGQRKL